MNTKLKKTIFIVLLMELFLFTAGVFIHEGVHSIDLFLTSGRFGIIHMYDSTAFCFGTIGVCTPPQGVTMNDSILHELPAYGLQFLCTGLFAMILMKVFNKKEGMKND